MKQYLLVLPLTLTLSSLATAQTTERNKAVVIKWAELLRGSNKDLAAAQALVTSDWVIHGTGVNFPPGPEGLRAWHAYVDSMWIAGPPTTEEILAEGDKVVRRTTVHRTLKSNNRASAMTAVFIYRMVDGKIAEVWRVADALSSYQQVGARIILPGATPSVSEAVPPPVQPESRIEPTASDTATIERNKALVTQWAAAMWSKDLPTAQALVTDDCVIHATGFTFSNGPEGIRQWLSAVDSNWTYGGSTSDDIIAEGDKVARRTTVFAMYRPNHRGTVTPVIFLYRIAHGKIAEVWQVANYVQTYVQAGARVIMPGAPEAGIKRSEAEVEVLKAKQEFADAALHNDAAGRARFYVGDYAVIYGDGTVGDTAEQLQRVRSGRLRYSARTAEDVVVRVYGEMAVVIERRKQAAMFDGRPRPSDVRATEVWVKDGGDWRLALTQTTPVLPPISGPLLQAEATALRAGPTKSVTESIRVQGMRRIADRTIQAKEELLAATEALDDAARRNDADALTRIYADDYLFVTYAGTLSTREQQLESVRSGFMKFAAARTQEVVVRVYGDAAVVTKRREQTATVGGDTRPGNARVSNVWVKDRGRWQLVSSQVTPIVVPQPAQDRNQR